MAQQNASGYDGCNSLSWTGQLNSTINSRNFEEVSMGDRWMYSTGAQAGNGWRLEERVSGSSNDTINLNVNDGLIRNEPSPLQSSSSDSAASVIDLNVAAEDDGVDIGLCVGFGTVGYGVGMEINNRSGSSDDECLLQKRKAPEEASGQLPLNGNVENIRNDVVPPLNNIPRSLNTYTGSNDFSNSSQSDPAVTPTLGFEMMGMEPYMRGTTIVAGTGENFQRNIRSRTTEDHENLLQASMSFSGTSILNSHVQLPSQPSNLSPMNPYMNSPGYVGSTSHGTSSVGALPSAYSALFQQNVAENPQNSSATGVQLSPALSILPLHNNAVGQILPGIINQSSTLSAGSSHGRHSSGYPHNQSPSISVRDLNAARAGDPRAIEALLNARDLNAASAGDPRAIEALLNVRDLNAARAGDPRAIETLLRPGVLMSRAERQNSTVPRIPIEVLLVIAAQRRARLVAEVRRALELLRRLQGGEDVRTINHSEFFGEIEDDYDMHEDLRLDVDDMSYEQLLALGEHIGNVNTGLSEEAILAHMKRRKYRSVKRRHPVEPGLCCICQDEYVRGHELGKLDCGHDFHFDCIKQWLVQKNSCPICKKTGLAS